MKSTSVGDFICPFLRSTSPCIQKEKNYVYTCTHSYKISEILGYVLKEFERPISDNWPLGIVSLCICINPRLWAQNICD